MLFGLVKDTPINQRRIQRFRSNRRGWYSLWIFLVRFVLSLGAELIATEARGETDLARPTADGVREPLNRRTAVTISFR